MISAELVSAIKDAEGFRSRSYWDNKQWSWGYGTRAPGGPGLQITQEKAEQELMVYLAEAERNYSVIFQVQPTGITNARREALIEMLYNLGLSGFSEFIYTIAAIKAGNWGKAAAHAQNSLWYRQVGRRGRRIVDTLMTGLASGSEPSSISELIKREQEGKDGSDNGGGVSGGGGSGLLVRLVSWFARAFSPVKQDSKDDRGKDERGRG